ncbi:MAG: hypothetical protein JWQ81_6795 [Amycolatopsis sp.]|jgi:N-formylmaleamate deformylase|uniref:alpha/beta fold hydrolase n=1 Tax=Amycolatopsis sp. TaxID=37632 RepID=UPI00260D04C5|nr:alpha/beta hydrolase [Amycolatopsis sp.]MCU1686056.1 hypothetical protein [Amycolatopsis sp.]
MAERLLTQSALADLADIPAQSRWVHSGPVRLHVLDYGDGTADGANSAGRVPLVVLPGITSPAITMDFVARELTDLVRPVVVDVRGRGLSDTGHGHFLPDFAADTEAVCRGLALDRPLVLGHSMGARIAAVVAARERIPLRGTILVDPPMSGPDRGPYPTTLATFADQLDQARRGTDADEVALSWPRWPRREQELRARWLASCDPDAITAAHHGFEHEDFFDTWPVVPAPTVLIHGADSPVVTAAGAAEAATTNTSARLRKIPDAGHMVFWDNPAVALATLREVLGELLG